jgi:acetyl-CoA synthetase
VVLKPDSAETDALRSDLMQALVDELGKPLKPREILFADALPKTRNAKVMRRLIRDAYLGNDLGDTSSLEAPETIDAIRDAR